MERIRNGRSNVQVPKENYNFKKISTTKFKLNLGVEVKTLSVFLIFKNCFLRRTCWLWRLGLFNSLLPWKKGVTSPFNKNWAPNTFKIN